MSRHKKETRDSRLEEWDDALRQCEPRSESRFDNRHCGRPDRRIDHRMNHGYERQVPSSWNNNREYDSSERSTLVSASMDDLGESLDKRRGSPKINLDDSSSDGSSREHLSDYGSDSESYLMEAGAEVSYIRSPVEVKIILYLTYL